MRLLNFVLNAACLLLWLTWRSDRFTKTFKPPGISLAGTLRRAEATPSSRWSALATLLTVLIVRAIFYYQVGSVLNWTPSLELGALALPFRSDRFARILSFSVLSLGIWLAGFYSCLLVLSAVNQKISDTDVIQRWVRRHLGKFEGFHWGVKLALPLCLTVGLWGVLQPLLAHAGLVPLGFPWQKIACQGALIGIATALFWKFLILTILVLHLLNSYIHLGASPVWRFASNTALHLLEPLRLLPLRIGKVDFAPVLGGAVVIAIGEVLNRFLPLIYQRL